MYCNNCGEKIQDGATFCTKCGHQIPLKSNKLYELRDKHGRLIAVSITVFILVLGALGASTSAQPSSTPVPSPLNTSTPTPQPTPIPTPSENHKKNITSVVNIFCDNKGGGSGTILTREGIVVTNNHVIANSTFCLVTLPDEETGAPAEIYTAKPWIVPTLSKQYDIAMLEINSVYTDPDGKSWGTYPKNFSKFEKPDTCSDPTPRLGDSVRIYGYPVTSGGYNLTITDGVISSFSDNGNILTSAKIDSGNSGGLAVNQNGCMIGIPSAVLQGNYQNLGVIIPSGIVVKFFSEAQDQLNSAKQ